MDIETVEALDEIGATTPTKHSDLTTKDIKVITEMKDVVAAFSGGDIPLRLDLEDYSFGIPLDRGFVRTDPIYAFSESRKYTIFGRVEKVVTSGDSWDPTPVTEILDRYMSESAGNYERDELREGFEESAQGINMDMSEEHWEIVGPGSVVYPIAVYW